MKRIHWPLIAGLIVLSGCGDPGPAPSPAASPALPRIAIAGLAIESSTFSPARSHEDAFRVKRGDEVFTSYPFYAPDAPLMSRAKYFPALTGRAIPGGMVTRESYERMMGETLERLRQNLPYDGLLFDIHGAMSVEGVDDPEGDMIARIRAVVGDDTLISTSMDLHGNVSWRLAEESDLVTAYRMAPHEDEVESRRRALENLVDRLETGAGRPAYKAWIPVPILLPGEKTSTRVEPAKSLYAGIPTIEAREGVLDAAIWMGYPWADEPRNHAVVMVTGRRPRSGHVGCGVAGQSLLAGQARLRVRGARGDVRGGHRGSDLERWSPVRHQRFR